MAQSDHLRLQPFITPRRFSYSPSILIIGQRFCVGISHRTELWKNRTGNPEMLPVIRRIDHQGLYGAPDSQQSGNSLYESFVIPGGSCREFPHFAEESHSSASAFVQDVTPVFLQIINQSAPVLSNELRTCDHCLFFGAIHNRTAIGSTRVLNADGERTPTR